METDSSEGTINRQQGGNGRDQEKRLRPPLIGHSEFDIGAGGEPNDLPKEDTTDDDVKSKLETTRAPSPPCSISSITSNRKLEWDSGADVGYMRHNTNLECLSTIERMALEGGRNAFRMEPEGISSNTLQPLAKSTPRIDIVNTSSSSTTPTTITTATSTNPHKKVEEKYYKLFGQSKRLSNSLNDLTEIASSKPKRSFSNKDIDKLKKPVQQKSTSTSTMSTVISKNVSKSDKIIKTSFNIPMKLSIGLKASDLITLNIDPNGIKETTNLNPKREPFCSKCCNKKNSHAKHNKQSSINNNNNNNSTSDESSGTTSNNSNDSIHVHTLDSCKPTEIDASFEYLPGKDLRDLKAKLKAESQKTISSTLSSDKKFQTQFFKHKKFNYSSNTLERDLELSLEILKKVLKGRQCDKMKKDKLIKKIVKRIVETNYIDDSSSSENDRASEAATAATEMEQHSKTRKFIFQQDQQQQNEKHDQEQAQANSEIQACTDHSSVRDDPSEDVHRPQIEDKIPKRKEQNDQEISKITTGFTDSSSIRYYDSVSTSYPEVSSQSSLSRQSFSLKFSPESSKDDKKDTVDNKNNKKYNKQLHLNELQKKIDHLKQIKQYLEEEENSQIIENFAKIVNISSSSKEEVTEKDSDIYGSSSSTQLSQWPSHHYLNQGALSKTTQIPSNHRLYTPRERATQTLFDNNLQYISPLCSSAKPTTLTSSKNQTNDFPSGKNKTRTSTSSPCTEYTDTDIPNYDIITNIKSKLKHTNQKTETAPTKLKENQPSTKSTAYLLTFETDLGSDTSELNSEKQQPKRASLEEITVKIPARKNKINYENQMPAITQKTAKRLTLQEFLRQKRPDYLEKTESRQRCLEDLQVLRELRQESRRKLLEYTNGERNLFLKQQTQQKRERNRQNQQDKFRSTNRKNYLFQEQEAKRAEMKKKEEYRTNRLMAEVFTKKLQKKVLKGQVNLSTNASVISTL